MVFKFFILLITSAFIFSCQGKSNASDDGEGRPRKLTTDQKCVPEADLLAKNIVRGEKVNKNDIDEKTAVLLLGFKSNSVELCTANAIGKRVLLTAAHCLQPGIEKYAVALYPSLSCESGFDATKNLVKVQKVVRHAGYDDNGDIETGSNDIGLIFLNEDLPEDYPVFQIADPSLLNQNEMYLYGYGRTGGKEGGSGILRKAVVPSNKYQVLVSEQKVMINQVDSTGICQGDSGGAGFVSINNNLHILGVNSYVSENPETRDICGGKGYQTLVFPYLQWIEDKIKANEEANSSK